MLKIRIIFIFILLFSFNSFSIDTLKVEKEIYNKINSYRAKLGKSQLTYAPKNVQSCRKHSISMGTLVKLQHVTSLSEVNALAEIIQLNYTLSRTENETAQDVLDIFINSESHKRIIESNFKEIAVGVYVTTNEDLWVTIRFY